MNSHTFEVDLFLSGLPEQFADAMDAIETTVPMRKRMRVWATTPDDLDEPASRNAAKFLRDIETVGKGRFAQRLASIIAKCGTNNCPDYILKGVKYVAERCKRN